MSTVEQIIILELLGASGGDCETANHTSVVWSG